jgi:trk system potassium uptake protein TrkH
MTCTGFASADYLIWPMAGVLLIFILMFAGGSTGSTSGGIKMARHLIVLKNIKSVFIRLNHPNAIGTIKLNGKLVNESTNITIVSFVVLYIFLFIAGTVIIVITGVDPVTSASSVATCMAGIGPGLGTVGPMSNFAHLPEITKVVLSMLMIIGRLEIITVFALFTRSFWKI